MNDPTQWQPEFDKTSEKWLYDSIRKHTLPQDHSHLQSGLVASSSPFPPSNQQASQHFAPSTTGGIPSRHFPSTHLQPGPSGELVPVRQPYTTQNTSNTATFDWRSPRGLSQPAGFMGQVPDFPALHPTPYFDARVQGGVRTPFALAGEVNSESIGEVSAPSHNLTMVRHQSISADECGLGKDFDVGDHRHLELASPRRHEDDATTAAITSELDSDYEDAVGSPDIEYIFPAHSIPGHTGRRSKTEGVETDCTPAEGQPSLPQRSQGRGLPSTHHHAEIQSLSSGQTHPKRPRDTPESVQPHTGSSTGTRDSPPASFQPQTEDWKSEAVSRKATQAKRPRSARLGTHISQKSTRGSTSSSEPVSRRRRSKPPVENLPSPDPSSEQTQATRTPGPEAQSNKFAFAAPGASTTIIIKPDYYDTLGYPERSLAESAPFDEILTFRCSTPEIQGREATSRNSCVPCEQFGRSEQCHKKKPCNGCSGTAWVHKCLRSTQFWRSEEDDAKHDRRTFSVLSGIGKELQTTTSRTGLAPGGKRR